MYKSKNKNENILILTMPIFALNYEYTEFHTMVILYKFNSNSTQI